MAVMVHLALWIIRITVVLFVMYTQSVGQSVPMQEITLCMYLPSLHSILLQTNRQFYLPKWKVEILSPKLFSPIQGVSKKSAYNGGHKFFIIDHLCVVAV